MTWRNWAAAVAACLTVLAVIAGFASYDAFLAADSPADGVVAPIGWWLLAVPLAFTVTALLRVRARSAAALAWVALAAVLALAGWLARAESARPPTSLTTDSDVAAVLFMLLCLVCWTAALVAAAAGPALALLPVDRQRAPEPEVTPQRG